MIEQKCKLTNQDKLARPMAMNSRLALSWTKAGKKHACRVLSRKILLGEALNSMGGAHSEYEDFAARVHGDRPISYKNAL